MWEKSIVESNKAKQERKGGKKKITGEEAIKEWVCKTRDTHKKTIRGRGGDRDRENGGIENRHNKGAGRLVGL